LQRKKERKKELEVHETPGRELTATSSFMRRKKEQRERETARVGGEQGSLLVPSSCPSTVSFILGPHDLPKDIAP